MLEAEFPCYNGECSVSAIGLGLFFVPSDLAPLPVIVTDPDASYITPRDTRLLRRARPVNRNRMVTTAAPRSPSIWRGCKSFSFRKLGPRGGGGAGRNPTPSTSTSRTRADTRALNPILPGSPRGIDHLRPSLFKNLQTSACPS